MRWLGQLWMFMHVRVESLQQRLIIEIALCVRVFMCVFCCPRWKQNEETFFAEVAKSMWLQFLWHLCFIPEGTVAYPPAETQSVAEYPHVHISVQYTSVFAGVVKEEPDVLQSPFSYSSYSGMDAVLRLIWHYYYCVLSMWGRRWGWRYCWVCVFHFGGGGSVQEVNKKRWIISLSWPINVPKGLEWFFCRKRPQFSPAAHWGEGVWHVCACVCLLSCE